MKKIYAVLLIVIPSSFFSLCHAQIINNEAGNNTLGYGYSGNGGAATGAQLHTPVGINVDTAGNIFIADYANNVIRKVEASSGIITTFTGGGSSLGDGGPATAAMLANPSGLAFDAANNLYVSDLHDARVRKVDNSSGIITTVAGNGVIGWTGDGGPATAAEMNPNNVAIDRYGNIYIADNFEAVIRKVNTSGIISTVAGNNFAGYIGDGGQATAAELNKPTGVSVDTSGNIYIADYNNYVIRKVNTSGVISTVAGNNSLSYTGDGGPATSAGIGNPENIWVKKNGNLEISMINGPGSAIREVVSSSGIINTIVGGSNSGYSGDGGPATSAELNFPFCTAFNATHDMFIADADNQVVRRVDHSTGIITTFAGNNTLGWGYSGDGGVDTIAQLHTPNSVYLDISGDRYIADYTNQVIRKLSHDSIYTIAGNYSYGAGYSGDGGPATAAELNNPSDVAVDTSKNFYIADFSNNVIRKVSGGIITTVAGNYSMGAGFSGDGGPATAAELNGPSGVDVDSAGNIYIADYANNVIREVTASNGVINTIGGNYSLGGGFSGDGGPATSAQLLFPVSVRVGHGIVVVSEVDSAYVPSIRRRGHKINTAGDGNQDVREINGGMINTVAGNHTLGGGFSGDGGLATAAQLNNPSGIGLDGNNNIYIADYSNNVVRVVAGGVINTIAGNYLYGPGFSGNGGPATNAELKSPAGVAVNDTMLYIADNQNQVVRKVSISAPMGVNAVKSAGGNIILYPNPSNDKLFVSLSGQDYVPRNIQIFDIAGRLLLTRNITAADVYSFDVSELAPGMYILKALSSDHKQNIEKFIIER